METHVKTTGDNKVVIYSQPVEYSVSLSVIANFPLVGGSPVTRLY